MADTALKFGPQWLRALTDQGPSQQKGNSPQQLLAPQRSYKLADYRYSREEMLALFDETSILTDELRQEFPTLFSDKCQLPLALVAITEEEHRLWSRSINSEAVIRLQSKERGTVAGASSPANEREARGTTVDRGNGREIPRRGAGTADRGGRGRGTGARPGFYTKSYDDEQQDPDRGDFRKPFETRSISTTDDKDKNSDKSFTRPNDGEEARPKKDLRGQDSWRTGSRDDRGSWRARDKEGEGWSRPNNSWRDGREEDERSNGPRHWSGNSFSRDWDDGDDDNRNLPEWSLDDACS